MTTRTTKKAAPKKGAKSKTPARGKTPVPASPPVAAAKTPRPRDSRLPAMGTTLTRTFNGKEIRVEVLDAGFKFDGKTWRSLSAIAREVSGTSWNGFLFFNLQKRPARPAAEKAAPAATAEAK